MDYDSWYSWTILGVGCTPKSTRTLTLPPDTLQVLALRLMDGQVHSFNKCKELNIEPGSRSFDPKLLPVIKKFLLLGIVMTIGSVPPSILIPCLHILGHYDGQADLFAILRWYVVLFYMLKYMHIHFYTCLTGFGSCILRHSTDTSKRCASTGLTICVMC